MTALPKQNERERITARISKPVHEKLEEAASMTGATLNQFLVAAALKEAESVIARERISYVSAKYSDAFFDALDSDTVPNSELLKAVKEYKQQVTNLT